MLHFCKVAAKETFLPQDLLLAKWWSPKKVEELVQISEGMQDFVQKFAAAVPHLRHSLIIRIRTFIVCF